MVLISSSTAYLHREASIAPDIIPVFFTIRITAEDARDLSCDQIQRFALRILQFHPPFAPAEVVL